MEQRTKEWYDCRRGRFTASEIHKIMGIKGLNATGKTYAFQKAVEIVFGLSEEEEFISFDMQRGINLEPLAFRKFQEIKAFEFLTIEKAFFFPYGDNAGASPEALVGKDGILEIKCPRPEKFFYLVAHGEKAIDKEYTDQMQMQMLCTNSTHCYFFNYIIFNGVEMWHEIIVKRDEKHIELIDKRINEAVIERDKYVEILKEKKQF